MGNDDILQTQNTDLIEELAMEVPINKEVEYEDHHDDRN